jgi:hypothetical protein
MNPADEPLDDLSAELPAELCALYRRLEPSPPADEVSHADPETERVVRWVQGAWNALEAPPVRVPRSIPPRRSDRRFVQRALVAAAAALLLLAGAAAWRALPTRVEPARPTRVAQAPVPASGVEVLDVRPDQVELRSGPVRLVLLDPSPPRISDDPPGS